MKTFILSTLLFTRCTVDVSEYHIALEAATAVPMRKTLGLSMRGACIG